MKRAIVIAVLAALTALPVMAADKNMREIGDRLLAQATKGSQLLQICEVRKILEDQTSDQSGSIRIYVYSKKGSANFDMSYKDEGFEHLNVGMENMIRELGAKLVEKE